MKIIRNIIWFLFGGAIMGLGWWILGLLAYGSIIGIPWGKSCFVIGKFTFFPFGKEAISRKKLTQGDDVGTGIAGLAGNIIWFLLAGIWLAAGHFFSAILCFVTIIGIPSGIQHLKIARVSLFPIGKKIVPEEVAKVAKKSNME